MSAPRLSSQTETCPNCSRSLPAASVLCVSCGYHREKGQVLAAKHEAAEASGEVRGLNFATFAFPVATALSLGMVAWFSWREFESPGMSWSVGLIAMNLVVLGIGTYFALQENNRGVSDEERVLGWIGFVLAGIGCGFVALFFTSWLPIFGIWLGAHVLLIVANLVSPRE